MPDDLSDVENRLRIRLNTDISNDEAEAEEFFEAITIKSTLKIMTLISLMTIALFFGISLCR